ncbi:sel1 repeat family protein [Acidovorax sp. sic0104]|nr:sel1 repeat family protein [Acidovorax sp. sic0104]
MRVASPLRRGAPWMLYAALTVPAFAQLPPASPAPASPGAAAAATSGTPTPAPAQQTTAPGATVGARFIESCNEALERGVPELGCQGPIYRNELERLKREALNTQNPQLLSFVGDAYQNPRSGLGDMGQAYRWYLLAAVRGDPRAMQRLSEMNRKGQGVPKDNVRALGYARLLERMAQPDTGTHRNVLSVINELGAEMAVEEVALAERFASELEARVQRQAAGDGTDRGGDARPAAAAATRPGSGLPGMTAVPRPAAAASAAAPGSTLPGVPGKAPP